ncbi:MAG: glycosyltransferase family 39 protein [Patescibacteria group bacterium]|jgi:4-amino-4-deoxy-L-arabinose transferase-like glycosyltransferase
MKKLLPILILLISSALLIFYRFTDIPKFLAPDEVDFARLAYSLENKPYAPYSQLATGHSTLYFYILLASLKTFGANIFALRLPAAIFGVLSVLIFYLVLKTTLEKQLKNEPMKQWLPFLLSMILLTSRWFLNFARFSFEPTFLLFLELASIYFLLRCINTSKYLYFILCGLFSGLAFLSYTPGRIFFILPLSFFVFKLVDSLTHKQFDNKIIKQLLYFLIPFVIIITPLTSYLLINKDSRVDQQFLLTNHELSFNEKASGLWNNIFSTTLMFFTKGDMNGRHNFPGKPALNPILGILFIFGSILTIKQWKNDSNKLFLFYFLISLLPALVTYSWENPNMLRTYTSLPSIVFFIGQGMIFLFKKNIQIVCLTLMMIICISSAYELHTYFVYQPFSFKNSFNQPDYLPVIHKDAQNKQK